jgi:hypothetical protein
MKRYAFILLVFFFIESIYSQDYQMISSTYKPDNSKDCRKIGNCISEKFLEDDILYLTLYFDNHCQDLSKLHDTFNIINDTLQITLRSKGDHLIYSECIGGYDTRRAEYKLIGIKYMPRILMLNNVVLIDCPSKPFSFEIFKNDTINMINANGRKHGLWLSFFENGAIHEKKYYDSGRFLGGTSFDQNGNDLHIVNDDSDGIITFHSDTLQTK